MEVAKLALSSVMLLRCDEASDVPAGSALHKYAHLLARSAKMAVPAFIYLVMNLLGFVALSQVVRA